MSNEKLHKLIERLEAEAKIGDQGDQFVRGYNAALRGVVFDLKEIAGPKPKPADSYDNGRFAKDDVLEVTEAKSGNIYRGYATDDRSYTGWAFFSIIDFTGEHHDFNLNSDKVLNISRPDKNR